MKSLKHLIYASRAAGDFAEHELPALLKQARLSNAKRQLTGMLVYVGGSFVQVIEGEPGMVEAVFASILRDKRHEHVNRIVTETVMQRSFEGWTLGHATVDPLDAGEIVGEPQFFVPPEWPALLDATRAKKLLWALNKRRWEVAANGTAARSLGRTA